MKIAVTVDVAVAGHGGAGTDLEVDLRNGTRSFTVGDGVLLARRGLARGRC